MGKPDMGSNYINYWLFNQIGLDRGQKYDHAVKWILKTATMVEKLKNGKFRQLVVKYFIYVN